MDEAISDYDMLVSELSLSDLSDEEMDVTVDGMPPLPDTLHEEVKSAISSILPEARRLLDVIPNEYKAAQLKTLKSVAEALERPPRHSYALIGQTGCGKSTLVNALLGKKILPSSASGACTANITEISYRATRQFEAKVELKSGEEWSEALDELLAEAKADYTDTAEGPSSHDAASLKFSSDAIGKLCKIYPWLHDIATKNWSKADMLRDPVIANFLDDGQRRCTLISSDPKAFAEELGPFLASTMTTDDNRALWMLVKRVQIFGPFDVLSTGVALVDLPGYGDTDAARDRMADEYLKSADTICIVGNINRAADDKGMQAHFHDWLQKGILTGRAREHSLCIILTGADSRIGTNEIDLPPETKAKVDGLEEVITVYSEELAKLEKKQKKKKKRGKKPSDLLEVINNMQRKEMEATMERNNLLAMEREQQTKARLTAKYTEIHTALSGGTRMENMGNHIVVFAVGSRDFLSINRLDSGKPAVFFSEKETRIPALRSYLRNDGERRTLLNIQSAITQLGMFLNWALLPTSPHSQHSPAIDQLENSCLETLKTMTTAQSNHTSVLLQAIEAAVAEVSILPRKNSLNVFEGEERRIWNSYAAMMRRNGVYDRGDDLNKKLTCNIFPSIAQQWNIIANNHLTGTAAALILTVQRDVTAYLRSGIDPRLEKQMQLLLDHTLLEMHRENQDAIGKAQRYGVDSFENVVKEKLAGQYALVTQESGPGMYNRMKQSNRRFIQAYAPEVFGAINISVRGLFTEALDRMQTKNRGHLEEFFRRMRFIAIRPEEQKSEPFEELKEFGLAHQGRYLELLDLVKARMALQQSEVTLE
ncbi:Glycosyltransferase family 22 protein [Mycena kentingensis (nom. inval.)]|nr:Glycosyltransferase family 22 protein [Mycena kentingensis (nom. inval.)]